MAPEFLKSDLHGLFRLAVLVDAFWREPSKELAAEIRLQQAAYGLSPLDRRRLQWEIKRSEAEKKPQPAAAPPPRRITDPRRALRALK